LLGYVHATSVQRASEVHVCSLKNLTVLVIDQCFCWVQDIFDKELNDKRKSRWAKAFAEVAEEEDSDDSKGATSSTSSAPTPACGNIRALIVLEHIIQVSF